MQGYETHQHSMERFAREGAEAQVRRLKAEADRADAEAALAGLNFTRAQREARLAQQTEEEQRRRTEAKVAKRGGLDDWIFEYDRGGMPVSIGALCEHIWLSDVDESNILPNGGDRGTSLGRFQPGGECELMDKEGNFKLANFRRWMRFRLVKQAGEDPEGELNSAQVS